MAGSSPAMTQGIGQANPAYRRAAALFNAGKVGHSTGNKIV
jgi:hypothetical protein